jgi:DNA-binding transcriptional LysR family regulator
MGRDELGDLIAFVAVAEERSFTRAAARLGISQSALSQAMRRLETRHEIRLLTRTTRSVLPTDVGEELLRAIAPAFGEIEAGLAALNRHRERPSGNFRITAGDHAVETVLWPVLSDFLRQHPEIKVELTTDAALQDIVAQRYDAGVRLGEQVAKDMIAVRIGPDIRMLVVGTPSYLADAGIPQTPQDLTAHDCINMRFPTHGGLYVWEFEKEGREVNVRVEGQLVFNKTAQIVEACLAGYGLAFVMEDHVREHIAAGRLVHVLGDWSPPFAGYHLYYPSRRQPHPAFKQLVDALRYRG